VAGDLHTCSHAPVARPRNGAQRRGYNKSPHKKESAERTPTSRRPHFAYYLLHPKGNRYSGEDLSITAASFNSRALYANQEILTIRENP
jgi:hypothetical protein